MKSGVAIMETKKILYLTNTAQYAAQQLTGKYLYTSVFVTGMNLLPLWRLTSLLKVFKHQRPSMGRVYKPKNRYL